MKTPELEYRKPLQWGEIDPYRRGRSHVGMWAWLLQRISAILIVACLCLHVFIPYKPYMQFILLLMVTFHATLGLRVILLDFNLVNVKHQRWLIPVLLAFGLAVLAFAWVSIY